jgi:hypothetical protein
MRTNSTKAVFESLASPPQVISHSERLKPSIGWMSRVRKKRSKERKKKLKLLRKKRPKLWRYKDYIKSLEWRNKRFSYYSRHKKECVLCKSDKRIGLHHIDYTRLGSERDEDLIVLCWRCHERYHREHATKQDMREETFNFIIEGQEELEFSQIVKNL